jgi:hypothetical protein
VAGWTGQVAVQEELLLRRQGLGHPRAPADDRDLGIATEAVDQIGRVTVRAIPGPSDQPQAAQDEGQLRQPVRCEWGLGADLPASFPAPSVSLGSVIDPFPERRPRLTERLLIIGHGRDSELTRRRGLARLSRPRFSSGSAGPPPRRDGRDLITRHGVELGTTEPRPAERQKAGVSPPFSQKVPRLEVDGQRPFRLEESG